MGKVAHREGEEEGKKGKHRTIEKANSLNKS